MRKKTYKADCVVVIFTGVYKVPFPPEDGRKGRKWKEKGKGREGKGKGEKEEGREIGSEREGIGREGQGK